MKKILLVILTISASFAFNGANAQWCGTVNSFIANPTAYSGFPNPDSIACAIQGQPYSDTIYFQMYTQFTFEGQNTVDSVTLDTFWNLPCGLCWSLNKASRTYAASEYGVLYITGTTSDAVGQYPLDIVVTAYVNGDPQGLTIPPSTVSAAGIRLWLRVASVGGTCTPVDTSSSDTVTQQTPSTSCPTGINQIATNVASVNIVPNPFSSTAQLTVVADKYATYIVKITDITGKVISAKEMQVVPGTNTTQIERGNLSSGIYLLSLFDGVSSVTRKFTIVE